MEKKISTLLFCLLCSYSIAQQPQRVTRLRISVSEMFAQREYVITDSTIRVELRALGTCDTLFSRLITREERNELLAPLDNVYLSNMKSRYQNTSTDFHGPDYTFTLVKGAFVKQIRPYGYKISCLVNVSNRLNMLLPPTFQLRYATKSE